MDSNGLIYYDEVHEIVGAAIEVLKRIGPGVFEAVYHECLALELDALGIPFESEVEIRLFYRGQSLVKTYRVDLLCYDDIIVELKAGDGLLAEHTAQVLNYLKLTNKSVGLLINFGKTIEFKRFINTREHYNADPIGMFVYRD